MQTYLSMKFLLRGILIVIIWGNLALSNEFVETDGSILLPQQKFFEHAVDRSKQMTLTLSDSWQSFVNEKGNWAVQWNEYTNTPHRAFGKSIPIKSYSTITEQNIESASLSFINEYASILKVNSNDLEFVRANHVNRKWYVTYKQIKEGIDVLFSEVELRLFEDGQVMAFGSDFYQNINISLKPAIGIEQATLNAIKYLEYNSGKDKASASGNIYILPVEEDRVITYHLVYHIEVTISDPVGNYDVFVDAHNGQIIWRHNKIRYIDTKAHVSGDVQLMLPTDPFIKKDLKDQYIDFGGSNLTTDSLGLVVKNISSSENLSAELRGPWVNVNRQDAGDASFSTTINPGDSINIYWNTNNSHDAERDAFYHVNVIHNFITDLDPTLTYLNYSMPCAVNINSTCNAYWDGTGINFFAAGGGCPNTGQMPSVIYHEYGHGINDKLYQQAGSGFGMINGATHEGMADVIAALIEDDPGVGRGFFGAGSVLRNLVNTNRYPDDISGEVHYDGLIIGGAFWDLRQLTSLQTAHNLAHFSKWGLPDDANTGIAFSEWFVEVLVTDDDDGDISNGTPNFTAINNAFNAHGIGTSMFMNLSYAHTPLEDTQDTTNTYNADFHLEGIGIIGGIPDSVILHYSTDNFQNSNTIQTTDLGSGNYQALIPAQSAGSIVRYYLTAFDPLGSVTLRFPSNNSYSFLVGFNQFELDELEVESGWTVGAPDDNASTGIWERTDPQATSLGSQPENDHTVSGTHCFVTDGRNSSSGAGAYDVDGGKTTLFSPVYDVSNLTSPIIRYYKWYSNDKGAEPGQDYWVVDVRNDTTENWISIENTNISTLDWEKHQFILEDYIIPSDKIQFRFIASDFDPGSLVEACIDDFEILSVNPVNSIGIANQSSNIPQQFTLDQNYPNPFNPSTTIKFGLPSESEVKIKIYNLLGQEIITLYSGMKSAGWFQLNWDGKDKLGMQVASGVYIYYMEAKSTIDTNPGFHQSKKLILLR